MESAPRSYTVSDGSLVLTLTEAEEGGFTVTSPMDPELITHAGSLAEAFELGHEVRKELAEARVEVMARLRTLAAG